MKALISWFLGTLFLNLFCLGQEFIQNSEKPRHENPGRRLSLREVLRIEGEGEDYFFNAAVKLQKTSNDNLLFSDSWSSRQRAHLMLFSYEGRFLIDMLNVGEGPGEIQSSFDFCTSSSEVFVYDYTRRKFVVMDFKGDFIDEWSCKTESFEEILGIYADQIVTRKTIQPTERTKSQFYEEKDVVLLISTNGKSRKEAHTFAKQTFYISPHQGWGMMKWDPFIAAYGEGQVFVCNSREYMVKVLNLEAGKITHRFSRKYKRVKHQKRDWEDEFVKKYNAPKIKFDSDIKALFYAEGLLWVWTSKTDDEKRALFDLFTPEGDFIDSFYIDVADFSHLCIDGDSLYITERDEDILPYIVKYQIDERLGIKH